MNNVLTTEENRLVKAMNVLGDPTRFAIYKMVCEGQNLCVSEMASALDVTPSAISQHFQNFELLGLLSRERTGQKICYKVNSNELTNSLCSILHEHKKER